MQYKVCPWCNYANDTIETHCQKCALDLDWVEPSSGPEVLESARHQPKKTPLPKAAQQPSPSPNSPDKKSLANVLQLGMPSTSKGQANRYPFANQYISWVIKWAQVVFIVSVIFFALGALGFLLTGIGTAISQKSIGFFVGGLFGAAIYLGLGWLFAVVTRMLQLAFANMLQCFIQIEENTRLTEEK